MLRSCSCLPVPKPERIISSATPASQRRFRCSDPVVQVVGGGLVVQYGGRRGDGAVGQVGRLRAERRLNFVDFVEGSPVVLPPVVLARLLEGHVPGHDVQHVGVHALPVLVQAQRVPDAHLRANSAS
eukprot:9360391-Pyramimonas_sp.AAC.1